MEPRFENVWLHLSCRTLIRRSSVELEGLGINLADIAYPPDWAPPAALVRPPTIDLRHIYRDHLKRAIDLALTVLALSLAWPLLLLIALLIRLDSPGPALFVQRRIGKGGRPFNIYKFRTMSHSLDDSSHRQFMQAFVRGDRTRLAAHERHQRILCATRLWTAGQSSLSAGHIPPSARRSIASTVYKPFSESQVTRIGRILRRASLDELPQLFNILKGDMSLIGPRPNVPWEVEAYKTWHRDRLEVLPGITGLAQVNGRSALDFDTIARYDIEYVRRASLGLDLRIALKTVSSVIGGQGAV
jgi:lipopolysaccharide/colanic/teichoic acid biosynthesis glycosyltransferase